MKKSTDAFREATAIIVVIATVFAGCVHLNDLSRFRPDLLVFGAGFGGFVGFAGLPYFSKKFSPRPRACSAIAALLGGGLAWWLGTSALAIVAVAAGSAIVGYFAPSWAKHVQF